MFEATFHRAKGLKSAKTGVEHWVIQRITAAALIPLGIWFVSEFIFLITASFEQAYLWLSSPWTITFTIFFVLVLFYHGYLGMRVIWEDYIPHEPLRWLLIITTRLFSTIFALSSVVCLVKIYLSSRNIIS